MENNMKKDILLKEIEYIEFCLRKLKEELKEILLEIKN